jgi:hypothetical protein
MVRGLTNVRWLIGKSVNEVFEKLEHLKHLRRLCTGGAVRAHESVAEH